MQVFGAWVLGLSVDGAFVRWLSAGRSDTGLRIFASERGGRAGQLVWEALGTVVAFRAWLPAWSKRRLAVRVRG